MRVAPNPQSTRTSGTQTPPAAKAAAAAKEGAAPRSGETQQDAGRSHSAGAARRPTAQTSQQARARHGYDLQASQLAAKVHSSAKPHVHSHGDAMGGVSPRPKTSTFADKDAAIAALKKDYGVNVRDGDRAWSTEELSRAHESFAKMSAKERKALKGLCLIRESKPSAKVRSEISAKGKVAGLYSPNVDTKDGKRIKPPSITMYDAAFPKGNSEASRRTSVHTFLHEAGHAVEGRKRDDAAAALNAATDKSNAAVAPYNEAVNDYNTKNDANNDAINGYNKAVRSGFKARSGAEYDKFKRAQNGVSSKLSALQSAKTPAARKKANDALQAAKAKRDEALAALPTDERHRDKADALVSASNEWERTQTALNGAKEPLAKAKATHAELAAETKAAQKKYDRVTVKGGDSKELAAFKRFRKGTKEKPVSGYGATKPSEDYAEAYGLYRRDPVYMKEHFPKAYKWFKKTHP